MLDYTGSSKTLGKPALNDLQSGLATAPVLYAAEAFPELKPLILRKFAEPGDVARAQELVFGSDGIERTRQLAVAHANKAAAMVRPASLSRRAACGQLWQSCCLGPLLGLPACVRIPRPMERKIVWGRSG